MMFSIESPDATQWKPLPNPLPVRQDGLAVWKFGGTSMANPEIYGRLGATLAASPQHRLLIVCSAVAGVTDRLVSLWRRVFDDENAAEDWRYLETRHLDLIENLFQGGPRRTAIDGLNRWLAIQRGLLQDLPADAASRTPIYHRFVSGGERLSSALLTLYLAGAAPVSCLNASEVLVHGGESARAVTVAHANQRLRPLLNRYRAVITQGFVAATPGGELTTLGRGGSDTSATLFARALQAESVVIWTDTPGVMSGDPRRIPNARTLPHLTYAEAGAMARHGAKVLHPKSMRPLRTTGIPVAVCNSFAPESPGTLIAHDAGTPRWAVSHRGDLCLARLQARTGESGAGLTGRIRALPAAFWEAAVSFDFHGREIRILIPRDSLGWLTALDDELDVCVTDGLSLLFVLQRANPSAITDRDTLTDQLVRAGITPIYAAPAVPLSDSLIAVPTAQSHAALRLLHDQLAATASHHLSSAEPAATEVVS